jgi:hypothetical protein
MKKVYWIDDLHDEGKPPSAGQKRRIEKALEAQLVVKTIETRSEFDDVLSEISKTKPVGFFMDYQLSGVGKDGRMAYGNTWANELRAILPKAAVIGISHEREKSIPELRLQSFLEFYQREVIVGVNAPFEQLRALFSGYEAVAKLSDKQTTNGTDAMLRLIKPPKVTCELLSSSIPPELRKSWDDETNHIASRWIWHSLMDLPGFLYDELELATYLGLNTKGLKVVAENFDYALYQGVFSNNSKPRWWRSQTHKYFEDAFDVSPSVPAYTLRRELLDLCGVDSKQHYRSLSRAHGASSPGSVPTCVAFEDGLCIHEDRVQALIEDTVIDDAEANPDYGFEARRRYSPTR